MKCGGVINITPAEFEAMLAEGRARLQETTMAVVETSEYKGNPMIVLKRNEADRFPFQFGLSKAKLIVEAFDQIKEWVDKQPAKDNGGRADLGD